MELFGFSFVHCYLILSLAFSTGKWISATVFECTCNCTGISNEKLFSQPKTGNLIIAWFLVSLSF